MTAPRQILPGATYLLSRRCSERRKLLHPGEELNQIVLFVLAVAAERYGIAVHAYCVLSNHLHIVLSDPRGQLPAFAQYFCALVARSCNALHGHWESFWAPGSYSAVRLLDEATIVDKIAYTLANPVSAGLVRHASLWPGLCSSCMSIGGPPIVVQRPNHFFRDVGPLPAEASLRLFTPPDVASVEEFRASIQREVQRREEETCQRFASEGRDFEGVERVMAQQPLSTPPGGEPRRNLNPRIACRDRDRRTEALRKLQAFVREYREAWREFARGLRRTIFPHGTYWMRVACGVSCAPAG